MATQTNPTRPAEPSLQERTVATIKQAHEIMQSQLKEIKTYETKVSEVTQDEKAAAPLIDTIIDKLATHKISGEFLVPPEMKSQYRRGAESKEGMAQIMDQVIDILIRETSGSKQSSALGGPAETPNVPASRPTSGFGSVPRRPIAM
jgi:hypothetical protein